MKFKKALPPGTAARIEHNKKTIPGLMLARMICVECGHEGRRHWLKRDEFPEGCTARDEEQERICSCMSTAYDVAIKGLDELRKYDPENKAIYKKEQHRLLYGGKINVEEE